MGLFQHNAQCANAQGKGGDLLDPQPDRFLNGEAGRTTFGNYPDFPVRIDANGSRRCTVVVNATPLGMKPGDPLPADVETGKTASARRRSIEHDAQGVPEVRYLPGSAEEPGG